MKQKSPTHEASSPTFIGSPTKSGKTTSKKPALKTSQRGNTTTPSHNPLLWRAFITTLSPH